MVPSFRNFMVFFFDFVKDPVVVSLRWLISFAYLEVDKVDKLRLFRSLSTAKETKFLNRVYLEVEKQRSLV
jgi:hypothetical protein